MAELAIPLMVLGGMYVASNQENNKSNTNGNGISNLKNADYRIISNKIAKPECYFIVVHEQFEKIEIIKENSEFDIINYLNENDNFVLFENITSKKMNSDTYIYINNKYLR